MSEDDEMKSLEGKSWIPSGNMIEGIHYFLESPIKQSEEENPAPQPLVVFIHGIGFYNFGFQNLAKRLRAQGYRTLVYDNIGLGHSVLPTHDSESVLFGGQGHVEQLRTLMQKLDLLSTKYSIVCHSMGGGITLLYANKYAEEIDSIIFLSPAGLMDLPLALRFVRSAPSCLHGYIKSFIRMPIEAKKLPSVRTDFVNQSHPNLEFVEQSLLLMHDNNHQALEAFFQSALHFPLSSLQSEAMNLSASNVRVCVLWGELDTVTPLLPNLSRWVEAMKDRHAFFAHQTFTDTAHLFFLEKEDDVASSIIIFLSHSNSHSTSL